MIFAGYLPGDLLFATGLVTNRQGQTIKSGVVIIAVADYNLPLFPFLMVFLFPDEPLFFIVEKSNRVACT